MNRRDIVFGAVVLAVLAGAIFYFRQPGGEEELPVPQTLSVEDEIEGMFNVVIPDDVEKAELKDTLEGDSSAIATRKFENETFEVSILADLPEGSYSAQLEKDGEVKELGTLRIAKGGYLLEYSGTDDLSEFNTVRVNSGGSAVLEGDF